MFLGQVHEVRCERSRLSDRLDGSYDGFLLGAGRLCLGAFMPSFAFAKSLTTCFTPVLSSAA